MQLIKLYSYGTFLEKECRLTPVCPYSIGLSKLLINLAIIYNEPRAKELRIERSIYKGSSGLRID
ncbi:hypothetical protein ACTFQF_00320 [Aliivibrio fischeri]|uniref:hypothetical protein n=1 Tax=Aliivibrio fischeri TaxID=668 RepID=UPI0007C500DE